MLDDPRAIHEHDQSSTYVRNLFNDLDEYMVKSGFSDGKGQQDVPELIMAYVRARLGAEATRWCRHLSADPSMFERVPVTVLLSVPMISCQACFREGLLVSQILSLHRANRCDICDTIEPSNKFAEVTMRVSGNVLIYGNRGWGCECAGRLRAEGLWS